MTSMITYLKVRVVQTFIVDKMVKRGSLNATFKVM